MDLSHASVVDVLPAGAQAVYQVQIVPRWKAGVDLPPFPIPWTTRDGTTHPTGCSVCQLLNIFSTPSFEPIVITRGVAMHLYFLIIYPSTRAAECKAMTFTDYFRVLAALSCGGCVAAPDKSRVKCLQQLIERASCAPRGLAHVFNNAAKERQRRAETRGMTIAQAREFLIREWDLTPLGFNFGVTANSSGSASSGGGGGDGGDGGSSSMHVAGEAAPCSLPADLDPRVQAFAAACVQRAFFSPALVLTTWHEAGGAMPFDVLSIIHEYVAPSPMPIATKRAKTYQMQAVELRGQVDALKQEVDTLQVALSVAQLEPTQLHRHVEAVRAKAHSDKLAADATAAEAAKEHTAALKEARR